MEQRRDPRAATQAEDHVTELRKRRIRETLLDVHLHDGDQRHQRQRQTPDQRDKHQRVGRHQSKHAGDQVDAGGHHRGGVDQSADWSGAGHRIGKPDVQGKLGALAHRPAEQPDPHHRRQRPSEQTKAAVKDAASGGRLLCEYRRRLIQIQRAELVIDQHQADQKAEIPDAVGDKRLDRRSGSIGFVKIKPDQQIAAQPDQLPEDKQKQQVAADDQPQHAEREQRKVGKEPAVLALPVHLVAVA